jgi:SPP1 family predicted phage head-tail adaptor
LTGFRPGALRHRLTLQQLARQQDQGGGFTENWQDIACLWAGLRPRGGDERVEGGRVAGQVTHAVVLRYREGVLPTMRFAKEGRAFEILAVIDREERGRWLECLCVEREL